MVSFQLKMNSSSTNKLQYWVTLHNEKKKCQFRLTLNRLFVKVLGSCSFVARCETKKMFISSFFFFNQVTQLFAHQILSGQKQRLISLPYYNAVLMKLVLHQETALKPTVS